MAKKKETKVTATDESSTKVLTASEKRKELDKLCETINSKGLGLIGRMGTNKELDKRLHISWIETASREYNKATGGGIPRGKVTIVSGDPDSGKTGLLLATIAEQQKKDPNFFVLWNENEGSITDEALDFFGIDKTRLYLIPITRETAGEGVIDIIRSYIAWGYIDMVVVNSLKMLIPKSEQDKPMTKVEVAKQARMNSDLMKKLTVVADETNCALVLVQHLTTDIGGYAAMGTPKTLSGGLAIKFGAMLITEQRKMSIQDTDPIKRDEGLKIGVKVKKNHCIWGKNPYVAFEYFINYESGIDKILSALKDMIECEILDSKGAWIRRYDSNGEEMPDYKWNGKTAFKNDMEANPDKFNELLKLLDRNYKAKSLTEEEIASIQEEEEFIVDIMKKPIEELEAEETPDLKIAE